LPVLDKKITEFFRELIDPKYFTRDFFPAIRFYIDVDNDFFNIINLKYIICKNNMFLPPESKWKLIYSNEVNIYENTMAFSRAFIVSRAKFFQSEAEILKAMKEKKDNLKEVCYIYGTEESIKNYKPLSTSNGSKVRIIDYETDEVLLDVFMDKPGFLVLNDMYYPGWTVLVDGKIEQVFRTNYLFRSVFLPEGKHMVRFIFFPLSYYISKFISLLTIYMMFIYSFTDRIKYSIFHLRILHPEVS